MEIVKISLIVQLMCFAPAAFAQDEVAKNPLIFADFFSPNDDGHNDTFVIQNVEQYPNNTLKVYNRWGDLVFSTSNYLNDWKGTSDGGLVDSTLPEGTYFYQFFDGEVANITGKVTLKR